MMKVPSASSLTKPQGGDESLWSLGEGCASRGRRQRRLSFPLGLYLILVYIQKDSLAQFPVF